LRHFERCQKRKSWLDQTLPFPSQAFAVGASKMRWDLGRRQNVTRKQRSHCQYVDEPAKHAMKI
jgi:hypothetical protein